MRKMSILILAGEASGDYHAAAMVRELLAKVPNLRVVGIGGDKLEQAGMRLLHHYKEINTIGLSEGIGKLRNILKCYSDMKKEFADGGHDLFIPVDFPDVNLRLCYLAKKAGIKVCYFISPQIWAWRRGRIRKIKRRVDRMMTIFPFEEDIYRHAGMDAHFVGHTMVNELPKIIDKVSVRIELGLAPQSHYVALVPGSRQAEVAKMLPIMCEAASLYTEKFPETSFILPLAGPHLSKLVNEILGCYSIRVSVMETAASMIMAAADSGLVTSGTATLQAALACMPHAVVYKLDPFTWFLVRKIIKPILMDPDIHVAIANVLAIKSENSQNDLIKNMLDAGYRIECQECGRPLFVPEILQEKVAPEELARWLVRFQSENGLREALTEGFEHLRKMLAAPGSGRTPAGTVMEMLNIIN
jgi:lipid-A-disaccharide synthase